jgi:hypothetical protein
VATLASFATDASSASSQASLQLCNAQAEAPCISHLCLLFPFNQNKNYTRQATAQQHNQNDK